MYFLVYSKSEVKYFLFMYYIVNLLYLYLNILNKINFKFTTSFRNHKKNSLYFCF